MNQNIFDPGKLFKLVKSIITNKNIFLDSAGLSVSNNHFLYLS